MNVFKDVLRIIYDNGLKGGHHLYINFRTNGNDITIPKWLQEKYPEEMMIIIQHEYWNFKINEYTFNIGLSFNNAKADLEIPYKNLISFADPYANFGLKFNNNDNQLIKTQDNKKNKKKKLYKDNVIEFKKLR